MQLTFYTSYTTFLGSTWPSRMSSTTGLILWSGSGGIGISRVSSRRRAVDVVVVVSGGGGMGCLAGSSPAVSKSCLMIRRHTRDVSGIGNEVGIGIGGERGLVVIDRGFGYVGYVGRVIIRRERD